MSLDQAAITLGPGSGAASRPVGSAVQVVAGKLPLSSALLLLAVLSIGGLFAVLVSFGVCRYLAVNKGGEYYTQEQVREVKRI